MTLLVSANLNAPIPPNSNARIGRSQVNANARAVHFRLGIGALRRGRRVPVPPPRHSQGRERRSPPRKPAGRRRRRFQGQHQDTISISISTSRVWCVCEAIFTTSLRAFRAAAASSKHQITIAAANTHHPDANEALTRNSNNEQHQCIFFFQESICGRKRLTKKKLTRIEKRAGGFLELLLFYLGP